jgi:Calx-beta domain
LSLFQLVPTYSNFSYGELMPTTLTAGDIAFSAFQADNTGGGFNGDAFEFVLMVPVTTGTTIFFTDNGYRTDTSTFRTNENLLRWVAQSDLAAGTVITFVSPGGTGSPSTAQWTGFNPITGGALTTATAVAMGLAAGGDNITALINPTFNPVIADGLNGTAIAAITFGGATFTTPFLVTSGNATTALPPGLTDGVNAISIAGTDNGRYNDAAVGSVEAGTQADVRASLNNDTYWTTSTNPLAPPNTTATFTITPTVSNTLAILATANAAEAASGNGTFRISRTTGDASAPLVVNYSVATGAGQATSGADYAALSGTATIAANTSFVDVIVTPVDDLLAEGTENVTLNLTAPSGYSLVTGQGTATLTIVDNDTKVAIENFGGTELSVVNGIVYQATKGTSAVNVQQSSINVGPNSFPGWSAIGVEIATNNEVQVMWKNTDGTFWYNTNTTGGGYVANVATYEAAFVQDFNNDGTIGVVPIEAAGTTSLSLNASNQYVATKGAVTVNVQQSGINVSPTIFPGWSVVGAEIAANDEVQVMWKNTDGSFWYNTNTTGGGYVANVVSYESDFQQDFNGDGNIGAPPALAAGAVRLSQFASNSLLDLNQPIVPLMSSSGGSLL